MILHIPFWSNLFSRISEILATELWHNIGHKVERTQQAEDLIDKFREQWHILSKIVVTHLETTTQNYSLQSKWCHWCHYHLILYSTFIITRIHTNNIWHVGIKTQILQYLIPVSFFTPHLAHIVILPKSFSSLVCYFYCIIKSRNLQLKYSKVSTIQPTNLFADTSTGNCKETIIIMWNAHLVKFRSFNCFVGIVPSATP